MPHLLDEIMGGNLLSTQQHITKPLYNDLEWKDFFRVILKWDSGKIRQFIVREEPSGYESIHFLEIDVFDIELNGTEVPKSRRKCSMLTLPNVSDSDFNKISSEQHESREKHMQSTYTLHPFNSKKSLQIWQSNLFTVKSICSVFHTLCFKTFCEHFAEPFYIHLCRSLH